LKIIKAMKIKANYILIPLVVIGIAVAGSWLTDLGMDWYETLELPGYTPSGGLIGAVWTIIFILGVISALLFVNKSARDRHFRRVVWVLCFNGLLNVFWSYLFFVEHWFSMAILEMMLLNLTTIFLIFLMRKVSRLASGLLVPYFLWVSFATYLAYQIWQLNLGV